MLAISTVHINAQALKRSLLCADCVHHGRGMKNAGSMEQEVGTRCKILSIQDETVS